jgi:formamidopyrimidine-DNA glycosylase
LPELPEVETIRRALEPELVGRRIESVRVRRADVIGFPASAVRFRRAVTGRTVRALDRRGKYLGVEFDDNSRLVFHLRLSGRLELARGGEVPRHERVRFELSGGGALSFVEPRALGRVYAYRADAPPRALAGMLAMGPEPIERRFDAAHLGRALAGRRSAVKTLILDQRVCCGVGNIYADEGLHRAGVLPARPGGSLTGAEVKRLAAALRSVLRDGIRWCGTTMDDGRYRLPDGRAGGFQAKLRVFARAGERCRSCGAQVRRTRIGGRGTHYCPGCQR